MLDRGAEPRRVLRHTGSIADQRSFAVAVAFRMTMLADDQPVASRTFSGQAVGSQVVTGVVGDEIQLREELQLAGRSSDPITRELAISTRGAVRADSFMALLDADELPMEPIVPRDEANFPTVPVGIGARWKTRGGVTFDGEAQETATTWTLVGLTDDRYVLELETKMLAPARDADGEVTSFVIRERIDSAFRFAGPFQIDVESRVESRIRTAEMNDAIPVEGLLRIRMKGPGGAELEPSAPLLPECDREIAQLREWNAQLERGEGVELWDVAASPILEPVDVPAGPGATRRIGERPFALMVADGAVTLLAPSGTQLGKPSATVDRAILRRLARRPPYVRRRPGMVLVYAAPTTPASLLAPLLAGAPRGMTVGIAVTKPGSLVAEQVAQILPDLPPWTAAFLRKHGARLMTDQLADTAPYFLPEVIRTASLCMPVIKAIDEQLASGGTLDVVVSAVLDGVEECRCEGVHPRGLIGVLIGVLGPMTRYGYVPVDRGTDLSGTIGDLAR